MEFKALPVLCIVKYITNSFFFLYRKIKILYFQKLLIYKVSFLYRQVRRIYSIFNSKSRICCDMITNILYTSWYCVQSPVFLFIKASVVFLGYFLFDDSSKSVPRSAHYINHTHVLLAEELHTLGLI